jgi:DHA1 family bicyclomycin/chloramphenicol resistance-like MFS transporter
LIAAPALPASRIRHLELLVLLGTLQAVTPLSIDMYLPALPRLQDVFGATAGEVQVTMVTFLVGFALGQIVWGPLTDRFGRKPPLYFSLLMFIASSAACVFAPSIPVMAAFRFVQAVGACGGAVITRAMVRDLFPPHELRKVFSMLVLVLGVSPIIAPLIGSYLLLWFGWKAAFLTQASLGLACLAGMHLRLPESLAHDARIALNPRAIAGAYGELFHDRTFIGASFVCGLSAAGVFAYIASAPFVFMSVYQVPTERFGWIFGSVAAGMVIASQINGHMGSGVPLWKVLRMANVVQLLSGLFLLAAVVTGIGGMWSVLAGIFVFVAAQGFVFPNGSAIAMMRHGRIAGTASALLGTNQMLIASIATAVLGLIDNPVLPMALVIAGCSIAGMALNLLTLGPRLEQAPVSRNRDEFAD